MSLAALANVARINRGTLSQVLRRQRPCGRADRAAIIHALGLGQNVQEEFLAASLVELPAPNLILLDPPTAPHPPLEQGQSFLIRAVYPEALREFSYVYRKAGVDQDSILQADAAARLGWAYFEMGLAQDSFKWLAKAVGIIESHLGSSLAEIIDSLKPGSNSALCTPNDAASHVLSRALHIRCKVLVTKIVYHQQLELRREAEDAFRDSLALDEHLQIPAQLGHDLRWKSVLMASGFDLKEKESTKLISASAELFSRDSLGAAYLVRDRGIVHWLSDRFGPARETLLEAIDGLASFADARALGPCFCALSKVILEGGADRRLARRYALAGGILDPYDFSLTNAREHFEGVTETGLRRDIDDLLSGKKTFDVIAPVFAQLTNGSSNSVPDRMQRNLSRIFGPQLRLPHSMTT